MMMSCGWREPNKTKAERQAKAGGLVLGMGAQGRQAAGNTAARQRMEKLPCPLPVYLAHWVTPLRFDALPCETGQTAASRILRVKEKGKKMQCER